jgi:hypothetical protein
MRKRMCINQNQLRVVLIMQLMFDIQLKAQLFDPTRINFTSVPFTYALDRIDWCCYSISSTWSSSMHSHTHHGSFHLLPAFYKGDTLLLSPEFHICANCWSEGQVCLPAKTSPLEVVPMKVICFVLSSLVAKQKVIYVQAFEKHW